MNHISKTLMNLLLMTLTAVFSIPTQAQIVSFSEDFESLDISSFTALSDEGWLVFGNIFDPAGNYLYGYGPEPAPNGDLDGGGFRFSAITTGEGGPDQGAQQLLVFSDYQSPEHGNGNLVESNVYQEFTIDASNVGKTYVFGGEFKTGDLEAPSTALLFIKTLDPSNNFALTNFLTLATDASPEWFGGSVELEIDASLEGQLFQVGFLCTASNFNPSGVIYDNIGLAEAGVCMIGDVNGDGAIDLLDVQPFVAALTSGTYSCEADVNEDGAVDLLDVMPFVDLLAGG